MMNIIVFSAARKYGVNPNELYSKKTFCEELIADLMNDPYIASVVKKEYSVKLANYIESLNEDSMIYARYQVFLERVNNRRNLRFFALYVGIMTAIFSIVFLLFLPNKFEHGNAYRIAEAYPLVWMPLIMSMILLAITLLRQTRNSIKDIKEMRADTERLKDYVDINKDN